MAPRKAANGRRTADDFLAQAQSRFPSEKVEIPELGKDVVVRALSARSQRKILESCLKPGKSIEDGDDALDNDLYNVRMLGACVQDSKGRRLVPVGKEDQLEDALSSVSWLRLQQAALRIIEGREGEADPGN